MTDQLPPVPQASDPIPLLSQPPASPATAPLFPLGQTVATPGALRRLAQFNVSPVALLQRHISGDWGDLDMGDRHSNNLALVNDGRLLSSYAMDREKLDHPDCPKIWVITEWDRSVTTILRPEDY